MRKERVRTQRRVLGEGHVCGAREELFGDCVDSGIRGWGWAQSAHHFQGFHFRCLQPFNTFGVSSLSSGECNSL